MDISSRKIQETAVIHLTDPATGEKLYEGEGKDDKDKVTITIASQASKAYRKAVNALSNRAIKRGTKKQTAQEQRDEGIELLVQICISSTNLELNGKTVQTEADFRALLSDDSYLWVKTQIDEALGDHANFVAK